MPFLGCFKAKSSKEHHLLQSQGCGLWSTWTIFILWSFQGTISSKHVMFPQAGSQQLSLDPACSRKVALPQRCRPGDALSPQKRLGCHVMGAPGKCFL